MSDDTPSQPTPRSLMNAVTRDSVASAVVPVLPDDGLDVVATRVRAAGASHVQLLVPAGATAFRSPRGFRALRVLLGGRGVQLLVVSGDPATLDAARQAGVDTLGLDASTRTTRVQPATGVTQPIDDNDAAFLRDLDQVGGDNASNLDSAEADLYGLHDDVPDAKRPSAPHDYSSEGTSPDGLATQPRVPRPLPEEAMRRLSDASPDRARLRHRPRPERALQSDDDEWQSNPRSVITAVPRRPLDSASEDEEDEFMPRPRLMSPNMIALCAIAALLLAGLAWALLNRVTVVLTPPAGEVRQFPFQGTIIPLNREAGNQNTTAVQALPVTAEAEYVYTEQVTTETVSPVGRAKGQITVQNTVEQQLPLPAGTEFAGQNADGAEVRFVIDQATTIGGAVRTATANGFTFEYGSTVVTITARSPGSASNVGPNAIKQIVIPGQPPIISDRSNFLIRHDAIGGGTEEPQRIVTEAEVQRALGNALTNLYNNGLQSLEAAAQQQGLAVDPSTVAPNIAALGHTESYDPPVITPPVGSTVDVANPKFTITVRTRFNALAAPADRPVAKQLETVVPQFFSQGQSPPCTAGESQAVKNVSWSWNGERLAIDGVVECTPQRAVSPQSIATVRAALVGQSREAAAATLDQYRKQGVIGGYQLPDRAELPPFELLIDVQAAPPASQAPAGP